MSRRDHGSDDERRAVEALQALDLTEYQARAFVGLYRLRRGTAREVAEASGVPRARVYDTLSQLHDEGLVDIQQSTPREYLAVPIATLIDSRAERYQEREVAVSDAFERVSRDADETPVGEEGVWVVSDRDRVASLEREFVRTATDRVVFGLATAEVFADETAEALVDASERAEVIVETADESAGERFEGTPGVDVVTPARPWQETPELEGQVGRVLVVDDRYVLVSTVLGADRGRPDEVAVWTSGGGPGDGLLLAMREFMLDRVTARAGSSDE